MAETHRLDSEEPSDSRQVFGGLSKSDSRQKLFLKISVNFIWFLAGVLIFAVISELNQRTPKIEIPYFQASKTISTAPKATKNPVSSSPSASSTIAPMNRFQEVLNKDPALRDKLAQEALAKQERVKKLLVKSAIIDYYKDETTRLETELGYKRQNELQIRKLCTKTAVDYESGHWYGEQMKYILKDLYQRKGAKYIADLGCGKCDYVEDLRKLNFQAYGYQYTMLNNASYIKKIDLSQKADLGRMYDFVESFEVGEHIYSVYEDTFIDNIVSHARIGVVLSWSIWGQIGFMHVNSRDNQYVIRKVEERGFTYSPEEAWKFRKEYTNHFADTVMVFFKN